MGKKNAMQSSKNKSTGKKLRNILLDALEKRRKALKDYKETPSAQLLNEAIEKIEFHPDSAIMLSVFDPEKETIQMFGIKAMPSDIQAMVLHALKQALQFDPAQYMDGVSTLCRQKTLNDFFANNVEPEEFKEGGEDVATK